MFSYVIPIFNSGNKIQIFPLNYNPTTCLNLSTAADVYSVVRHIVRRESSTLDVLANYLYKLTDRTSWQPRHPFHWTMFNRFFWQFMRNCFVVHSHCMHCMSHYMHCVLWCHIFHTASSSLRRTTFISLYLACLWGVYKFCHLDYYCSCVTDTELFYWLLL